MEEEAREQRRIAVTREGGDTGRGSRGCGLLDPPPSFKGQSRPPRPRTGVPEMGYITNADVEERLGTSTYVQLTDDPGTGTADEDKGNEARLGAEGEVNSYLARRVAVPVDLATWPELAGLLKSVVLDLVEYRLRGRRPPVPSGVSQRRDEAVQWLERVAAGEVMLPARVEITTNPAAGAMVASTGSARSMTREALRDL